MKTIIHPSDRKKWKSVFGLSRREIVRSILKGDWLRTYKKGTYLHILPSDLPKQNELGLRICGYKKNPSYLNFRNDFGFDLIFKHKGDVGTVCIEDVTFSSRRNNRRFRKFRGKGSILFTHVVDLAIQIGCDKINLTANSDGSWFWLRRGAIPKEWPDCLNLLIQSLFDGNELSSWKEKDRQLLKQALAEKNVGYLLRLVCRDNLKIEGEPFHKYLLTGRGLGECIFDLNDPWTQKQIRKRTGINVKERQKYYADQKALQRGAAPRSERPKCTPRNPPEIRKAA